jgi:hypothetical protein
LLYFARCGTITELGWLSEQNSLFIKRS